MRTSGELHIRFHVSNGSSVQDIEIRGAYILRLTYRTDAPDMLLITGQWIRKNEVFTLEYNLSDGRQSFIECDG